MYCAPGPVVGDHRMPTLRRWSGPGPAGSRRPAPARRPPSPRGRSRRRRAGSWNGSTSEAFSGHSTRLGPGDRAGSHLGGQLQRLRDVVVEHLLGAVLEVQPAVGQAALDHRDRLGAAVADPAPGPAARRGRRRAAGSPSARRRRRRRSARAASRRAARDERRGTGGERRHRPRATTKVTSGAPPSAANQRSGDSAWLKASRPHGNPPNGSRSRSASCSTQAAPTHSRAAGQSRERPAATRAEHGEERRRRRGARISHGTGPDVDAGPAARSGSRNAAPYR